MNVMILILMNEIKVILLYKFATKSLEMLRLEYERCNCKAELEGSVCQNYTHDDASSRAGCSHSRDRILFYF